MKVTLQSVLVNLGVIVCGVIFAAAMAPQTFADDFGAGWVGSGSDEYLGPQYSPEEYLGREYGSEEYLGREYGSEEYLGRDYGTEYLGLEYGDEYLGSEYGTEYLGREYADSWYGDFGYAYSTSCGCYTSTYSSYPSFRSPAYSSVFATAGYPVTVSSPRYTSSYPVSTSYGAHATQGAHVDNSVNIVDNSINGSFNNYNSNNVIATPVTPITYSVPTYPIVYTGAAPYCTINQAQAYSSGVTAAYLSWNSTNATSAYLSNVGSVSINGSQSVWPTVSTTYVLTVYGANGQSAQCQTTVYANANNAPYISLSQIPYTGFDFGTFGNAIYWAVLASFAISAAYLAIYFRGGIFAFAGNVMPKRAYAPIVATKAPIMVEREVATAKIAPIVNALQKSGTTAITSDSMAIVHSRDGSMPKIVITRG